MIAKITTERREKDIYGCTLDLKCLTEAEMGFIRAWLQGHAALKLEDGQIGPEGFTHRLQEYSLLDRTELKEDPQMAGFWTEELPPKTISFRNRRQAPLEFNFGGVPEYECLPGIAVQHLLLDESHDPGSMARRAESYGFHCLRSRRSPSHQYWEVWWLPSLLLAKGDLKRALGDAEVCSACGSLKQQQYRSFHVDTCLKCYDRDCVRIREAPKTTKDKMQIALDFLVRNLKFGTLDVVVQRYALIID